MSPKQPALRRAVAHERTEPLPACPDRFLVPFPLGDVPGDANDPDYGSSGVSVWGPGRMKGPGHPRTGQLLLLGLGLPGLHHAAIPVHNHAGVGWVEQRGSVLTEHLDYRPADE